MSKSSLEYVFLQDLTPMPLLLLVCDEQLVSRRACHIRHAYRPKTNVRRLVRGGQLRDSKGPLGRYEIDHLQLS